MDEKLKKLLKIFLIVGVILILTGTPFSIYGFLEMEKNADWINSNYYVLYQLSTNVMGFGYLLIIASIILRIIYYKKNNQNNMSLYSSHTSHSSSYNNGYSTTNYSISNDDDSIVDITVISFKFD